MGWCWPDIVSLANFSAGCIMGDIVGSCWSWLWAKVGCESLAVSGQLLGRFPNGAVGVKWAVTAKERSKRKE